KGKACGYTHRAFGPCAKSTLSRIVDESARADKNNRTRVPGGWRFLDVQATMEEHARNRFRFMSLMPGANQFTLWKEASPMQLRFAAAVLVFVAAVDSSSAQP